MDDLPVAMVDDTGASPVVYYIHTDQLGSPQKVTDASGDVVWDGVFDPFGNAVTNTGANWGTGIWDAFTWEPTNPQTMPLRFPGQYADTETALNQNWLRDYDPSVGRYIESDRVGLLGGINTYAYANGNALRYSDSSGLLLGNPATFDAALERAGLVELAGLGPEDPVADAVALALLIDALTENQGASNRPPHNNRSCHDDCDEQEQDEKDDCWSNYGSVFGKSDSGDTILISSTAARNWGN